MTWWHILSQTFLSPLTRSRNRALPGTLETPSCFSSKQYHPPPHHVTMILTSLLITKNNSIITELYIPTYDSLACLLKTFIQRSTKSLLASFSPSISFFSLQSSCWRAWAILCWRVFHSLKLAHVYLWFCSPFSSALHLRRFWLWKGGMANVDHLTHSSMVFSQKSCEWAWCLFSSPWLWGHLLPQPGLLGSHQAQLPSWNCLPVPPTPSQGQGVLWMATVFWLQWGSGSSQLSTKDAVEPAWDGACFPAEQLCSRSGDLCPW